MGIADWQQLAKIVRDTYDDFDGFVVLHGTDTMAYTASALSFMLQNTRKPIMLTGSQLPLGDIREDGTENIITALQIAAAQRFDGSSMVQEVAISFGRSLMRGNRATKISSTDFGAFASYNYPLLARIATDIDFFEPALWRANPQDSLSYYGEMDAHVSVIWLYPGMQEDALRARLHLGMKGIVLRTFGAGNAPSSPWFINALRDAAEAGTVMINITQCLSGGVEASRYETGKALSDAGVVSGGTMTLEAALTKLMHLFGRGFSPHEVKHAFQESLAGELGSLVMKD